MEDRRTAYLTEEELARLVAEVEAEGMLRAPAYLRDEILSGLPRSRRPSKNVRLFAYSVKVMIGAAAAIALLWLVPADSLYGGGWGAPPGEAGWEMPPPQPQGTPSALFGEDGPGMLTRTAERIGRVADCLCGLLAGRPLPQDWP